MLFVDGWTGKGAIAAELTEALAGVRRGRRPALRDDLAVIADPGHCSPLFGTRQDILVPSACLNSTVCGLVSRTVLNDELIGPGMFHGAKVYARAGRRRTARRGSSTRSAASSPRVAAAVAARWPAAYAADRSVTFAGAAAVAAASRPSSGCPASTWSSRAPGEATRVLLRRLPWLVLVRPDQPRHARAPAVARRRARRAGGRLPGHAVQLHRAGQAARGRATCEMPDPVLITTDLDRTLIFSPRATRQLGGGLPAEPVEMPVGQTAGELCRAARDAIVALPGHALVCLATSRSLARLARLRLPFGVRYAIAANGGVVLAAGEPDPEWAADRPPRPARGGPGPLGQGLARQVHRAAVAGAAGRARRPVLPGAGRPGRAA